MFESNAGAFACRFAENCPFYSSAGESSNLDAHLIAITLIFVLGTDYSIFRKAFCTRDCYYEYECSVLQPSFRHLP